MGEDGSTTAGDCWSSVCSISASNPSTLIAWRASCWASIDSIRLCACSAVSGLWTGGSAANERPRRSANIGHSEHEGGGSPPERATREQIIA